MKFEVIMRCADDGEEFMLAAFEAPDADAAVDLSAECFERLAAELKSVQAEGNEGGSEADSGQDVGSAVANGNGEGVRPGS